MAVLQSALDVYNVTRLSANTADEFHPTGQEIATPSADMGTSTADMPTSTKRARDVCKETPIYKTTHTTKAPSQHCSGTSIHTNAFEACTDA